MGVHHMFGVLLASNKVEGQATTITFLDILLDILCLKICLSQEKPLSPQAIHWREKHITHKMYKASIKKSDEFCKKYADSFHADITTLPMTFQSQPHQVPKLKLVNSAIKKRRARNPKLICLPILRQGLQTLVLIMARLQSHRVSKLVLLRFFQACWTPQSYKHSMMLLPTCHLRMWQWITTWAYHSRTSKTKWVKRPDLYVGDTMAALLAYLAVRGASSGPFFQLQDGTPLTYFIQNFRSALIDIGSQYVRHSFRLGVAMTAAEKGINQSNGKMEKPGLPELYIEGRPQTRCHHLHHKTCP